MTFTLRQRHRRFWLVLAVLLPVVFVAGLLARRPVPVMPGTTELLAPRPTTLSPR